MSEKAPKRGQIAVLGADSFIGCRVWEQFVGRGLDCVGTTRRAARVGGHLGHLDLEEESTWQWMLDSPPEVAIAFFAVSKLQQCEEDPASARLNATLVPGLLAKLAARGCRVVFLSTNVLFGGDRPLCREGDEVEPRIAYSRQKQLAELRLREWVGDASYAVVRITRTITHELPPFDTWLPGLRARRPVEAFDDFIFAPMTPDYVAEGLFRIAFSAHTGIFHLSGTDVTYLDLARELASQLGVDPDTVGRTNSVAKGVSLLFRPRFSALGMDRTTSLLGITPQTVRSVASRLISASEVSVSPAHSV